jgi:nucleoside-diphosphate-sugar epimerase
VTGSAGFLGRHFVAELRDRGHTTFGWDIADGLDAFELFRRGTARYDLVVHAAAQAPNRVAIDTQPRSLIYNAQLDAAMFEWATRTRQRRVVYLSSCAALDAEPDDYGLLKLTGERLAAQARRAGTPVTVVRPYSGYGEDQSADFPFGAFRDRAKRREDPFTIWGDGRQTRDWIHVSDVVNGALAVARSGTEDAVSLATGIGHSMCELAAMMTAAAGYRPTFVLVRNGHEGADVRVGDPTAMLRHYTPQVRLEDAVRRAVR